MKNWKMWGLFLCFFAIGVVFDIPLLRAVGGIGFAIVLYLISVKEKGAGPAPYQEHPKA